MRLDNKLTRKEQKSQVQKKRRHFSKKNNVKLIENIMYQQKSFRDSQPIDYEAVHKYH